MDRALLTAFGRTDARIAVLEEMPVGASLASALMALRAAPIDAQSSVRVHALWAKVIAWASAQQMIATRDSLHGVRAFYPYVLGDEHVLAAQEMACATAIPFATAMAHLELVERIDECMPRSWQALDRGELSLSHIKALHRASQNCAPALAERVETTLVPVAVARRWTPSELARAARKQIIAIDPEGAAARSERAKQSSDVEMFPGEDETATMSATGDALLIRQMMDTLDDRAAAMRRAGDDRPIGLRRFHALVDAVLGSADRSMTTSSPPSPPSPPGPSGPPGPRAQVLVTVGLTTLLGLNDDPAELSGYGPITAQTARRIAADASLRRLVTDPLTGDPIDLSRRTYRPSKLLRDLVTAAQPRCTMIGCSRPADTCELDHRHEFNRGGQTSPDNLQPLCKLHHQLKTNKHWKVNANTDGSLTWTSLLGFQYLSHQNAKPPGDPDPPAAAA